MNVLNRVTWNTLKKNRTRTIVTIIGVILSAAMITAVTAFVSTMQDYMIRSVISQDGEWHLRFNGLQAAQLPLIRDNGETKAYAYQYPVGYAALAESQNRDKPYLYIQAGDAASFDMRAIRLTQGRLPQNENELVLPEHLSTNGGVNYALGDTLTLEIGDRVDEEGAVLGQFHSLGYTDGKETLRPKETRTYTVVGICQRPNYEPYSAPGYTALTLSAGEPPAGTLLDLVMTVKHPSQAIKTGETIGAQLSGEAQCQSSDLLDYMGYGDNNALNSVLYSMAAILIALIMVGSISLIYNAFAISVSERSKLFGMLSSVGASSRQIRNSVFFEAGIISLLGIPLGILSGVAGIGVTLALLGEVINSTFLNGPAAVDFHLTVYPAAIIAAAAVAFVTILISAWLPARRASRMSAIDAMRQTKDVQIKARAMRTPRFLRKLFGMESDLALKNFRRNRRRYRATVFSLFISVVLFISSSAFTQNMKAGTSTMYGDYNYDMSYLAPVTDPAEERMQQLITAVKGLENVEEYAFYQSLSGNVSVPREQINPELFSENFRSAFSEDSQPSFNEDGTVRLYYNAFAMNGEAFDRYARSLGLDPADYRDPANPKAILLDTSRLPDNTGTYHLHRLFAADPGTLNLAGPAAGEDGENLLDEEDKVVETRTPVTIGAAVEVPPLGLEKYLPYTSSFQLVMSEEAYAAAFSGFSDSSRSGISFFFNTDNAEKLDVNLTAAIKAAGLTGSVYNIQSMMQANRNLLLIVDVFSYGFIILISLISVANVFNTISTNVSLRRREFAMLKSVGMTPGGFNRMINFECLFYGLKALLFGLPVSVFVCWLISEAVGQGVALGFQVPWSAFIIAIAAVFLVVFVTMMYAMSKVRRENIVDALKNENL